MKKKLEKRVQELEKRIVALEGSVQVQHPIDLVMSLNGRVIAKTVTNHGTSQVAQE